jgi:hypothetical protein
LISDQAVESTVHGRLLKECDFFLSSTFYFRANNLVAFYRGLVLHCPCFNIQVFPATRTALIPLRQSDDASIIKTFTFLSPKTFRRYALSTFA